VAKKNHDSPKAGQLRLAPSPVDVHVVALDANALREGGWPRPNAKLEHLGELVHLFGCHLWVPAGALEEARGRAIRTARKAANALAEARVEAQRRGLVTEVTCSPVERFVEQWDADSTAAVGSLRLIVPEHSKRTIAEIFTRAVDRVAPFIENGSGFRDTVIYLSVVDEMSRMGLESAVLVSRDEDFRGCRSPVASQTIHVMNLDATIDNFEALAKAHDEALFQQAFALLVARRQQATEAILAEAAAVEKFVAEQFEIGQSDVPTLRGVLKRPLAFRLERVGGLSLNPMLADVVDGFSVDASGTFEFQGEFQIIPYRQLEEHRLRLGEDLASHLVRQLLHEQLAQPAEQPIVVAVEPFLVGVNLKLTKTAAGFADVRLERTWHVSPFQRALLSDPAEKREARVLNELSRR
jgi:hypothetical protein